MLKKVTFVSFALASLLMAEQGVDVSQLKAEIAKAEQEKKAAEEKLNALKAKLPQDTSLKTHTKLGYISTAGNTRTESFALDTNWKKEWGKNKVTWMFDAQYGKAEDNGNYTTNKNKFFTELGYDYSFTKSFAFNYLAGYKHDKFSSYTYQFYTGPGAKYKVIKTKAHDLSLEGNLLYSHDEYIDNGDTTDYASFQAKGVYSWQILDNLKFEETASYRVDVEDVDTYFVYSDSEFSSKISDIFSAGLGYKIDYVNKPGDKKHTDRTLLATLSIDY